MQDIKTSLIHNWFQKVWNEGDEEAIGNFLGEDIIAHGATPGGEDTHGIEAFKRFYQEFRKHYKDIHVAVKNVISDENMESGILDCTATFMLTDTKVEFSGLCAVRIENGKTVEAWNQFDYMKMYQQMGFELKAKTENNNQPAYGDGKICYIELPSRDIEESAAFYNAAFGWEKRTRSDGSVAFDDTVHQVSGSWRKDRTPVPGIGPLIYIMVDDIETTIKAIVDNGGAIVQPVGGDAPEITARFTDPTGNILGLYQQP